MVPNTFRKKQRRKRQQQFIGHKFFYGVFAVPVLAILSPTLLAGENDEDISINNSTPVCLPEWNANGKFSRVPSSLKFQQMGGVRSAKRKLDFNNETDESFNSSSTNEECITRKEAVPKLKSSASNSTISTPAMLSDIGAGLVVVPMVAFLTSIAIAQSFSRKNNYKINPSQELIALGLANAANSFVSGFPIAGCFSRTTVNSLSGVATPFGGVVTSCVVLLALGVLTPFFQYIPKATLAAVVIVAVLQTVNIRIVKKIWRIRKIDVVPLVITFFACLYEIAIGIACGIVMALIVLLYRHFLPRVHCEKGDVCYIKLDGGLSYMGVQHFITKVREVAILCHPKPETVIIDCTSMFECDFTVSQGFLQILQDCQKVDVNIIFYNVRNRVKRMLLNDGLANELFKNDIDGEITRSLNKNKSSNGKILPDKSEPSINGASS